MKKKLFVLITALVIMIAISGISLAYLQAQDNSGNSEDASITVANFGLVLLTDIADITMNNTYPMTDLEGQITGTKATFQIKNTGSIAADYKVSLVDGSTPSTIVNSKVRYQLKRVNESTSVETSLGINTLDVNGVIDTGSIDPNVTYTYTIALWVAYDESPSSTDTFSKLIQVDGMLGSNLDKSGANYPELLDNMIPVYYEAIDDTTGNWKKADSKNSNSTYKWFDYDNFMWANAVTVKETGTQTRAYYLSAPAGTTIDMSDITSMWVWIPRYKYVIFNGNNGTADEQMIDITFEHGIGKTGTVSCIDNIITTTDATSSQTCTDTTNGSIINNKSTYTHPAFTFGDEELVGFWMGKFEMSTDDSTCLSSASGTNCNKTGLNILVKPNVTPLSYQRAYNLFLNTRGMEFYDNIHGFKQSVDATSISATDGSNIGIIPNDDNKLDIHMQKSMEWGAVAYLSNSKYGKYGNSLYEGEYKEVYKNNKTAFTTGYSGGIPVGTSTNSASSTFMYNDLTIATTGRGYRGAGASTTGTIYGVYDMVGGKDEFVMGIAYSNNFSCSGGCDTTVYFSLGSKYFDYYSRYGTTTTGYVFKSKLGDAQKEVLKTEPSSGWFADTIFNVSNYWQLRGGSRSTPGGMFYMTSSNGSYDASRGSRPVLAISRNMPWLN